jgi:hypothetical protein
MGIDEKYGHNHDPGHIKLSEEQEDWTDSMAYQP